MCDRNTTMLIRTYIKNVLCHLETFVGLNVAQFVTTVFFIKAISPLTTVPHDRRFAAFPPLRNLHHHLLITRFNRLVFLLSAIKHANMECALFSVRQKQTHIIWRLFNWVVVIITFLFDSRQ